MGYREAGRAAGVVVVRYELTSGDLKLARIGAVDYRQVVSLSSLSIAGLGGDVL